ncbi:hypothetical protein [Lacticaseibacillus porcinae]|uniref:hypothetical protein n=1 Tax=Lacticaseibacillus porcinae TaxID=1123687 RepID=UPI000F77055F|nr:hypothetical protein [Lacticaseibacillus porcinae]
MKIYGDYRMTESMIEFYGTNLGHFNQYLINKDDVLEIHREFHDLFESDEDVAYYEICVPGVAELLMVKAAELENKVKSFRTKTSNSFFRNMTKGFGLFKMIQIKKSTFRGG